MDARQSTVRPDRARLSTEGDQALVARARTGSEEAVRVLVQRHNRRLFRVARAVVRDDAEAEDIVQEAYVRAFTHLDSFRGEALFATWLTRITLNEALGRVRRRPPTVGLGEREVDVHSGGLVIMFPSPPPPADPEAELARSQVRAVLEHAIDELPATFRLVFVLRDVEGLSTEETAAQLAIREETVKTRLHRARRLMRTALEQRLSAAFAELFPFDGARCARMAGRVAQRLREETRP